MVREKQSKHPRARDSLTDMRPYPVKRMKILARLVKTLTVWVEKIFKFRGDDPKTLVWIAAGNPDASRLWCRSVDHTA